MLGGGHHARRQEGGHSPAGGAWAGTGLSGWAGDSRQGPVPVWDSKWPFSQDFPETRVASSGSSLSAQARPASLPCPAGERQVTLRWGPPGAAQAPCPCGGHSSLPAHSRPLPCEGPQLLPFAHRGDQSSPPRPWCAGVPRLWMNPACFLCQYPARARPRMPVSPGPQAPSSLLCTPWAQTPSAQRQPALGSPVPRLSPRPRQSRSVPL